MNSTCMEFEYINENEFKEIQQVPDMLMKNNRVMRGGSSNIPQVTAIINTLSENPAVVHAHDRRGNTMLQAILQHKSFGSYKADIVRVLLEIYPEASTIRNGKGMLPLHTACQFCAGDYNTVKMILDVNREAIYSPVESDSGKWRGCYALHIAVANNPSQKVLELLQNEFPACLLKGNGNGASPLSVALRYRASPQIVRFLLASNKSMTIMTDKRLNVPLHIACCWGFSSTEVIELLVDACPDVVNFKNLDGKTPLDLASVSLSMVPSTQESVINYLQEVSCRGIPINTLLGESSRNVYKNKFSPCA